MEQNKTHRLPSVKDVYGNAQVAEEIAAEFKRQTDVLAKMVEVKLHNRDAFLIIKETLTRIGVASENENKLHQSCHILHKGGKYYITHFKLLFELDGKTANMEINDFQRQNTIAKLLESWNLVTCVSDIQQADMAPLKTIKIVANHEKQNWQLISKHRIGRTHKLKIN